VPGTSSSHNDTLWLRASPHLSHLTSVASSTQRLLGRCAHPPRAVVPPAAIRPSVQADYTAITSTTMPRTIMVPSVLSGHIGLEVFRGALHLARGRDESYP
jgi:hypothetical protein